MPVACRKEIFPRKLVFEGEVSGPRDAGRIDSNLYSIIKEHTMGCGQAVRHRILVPAFGGSNPSTPAILKPPEKVVLKWLQEAA